MSGVSADSPPLLHVASGRGESHPPALSEPCVNLSIHSAPITQSHGRTPNCQWAKSPGAISAILPRVAHARLRRRRSRLHFCVAQRIR